MSAFRRGRGGTDILDAGGNTVRVLPADDGSSCPIRVENTRGIRLALSRAAATELANALRAAATHEPKPRRTLSSEDAE